MNQTTGIQLIESTLSTTDAYHRVVVPAGEPLVRTVRAGERLRIVDLEGNQAVDTLFYANDDPEECYSATDTIRAQGNVYLTTGSTLRVDESPDVLGALIARRIVGTRQRSHTTR